MFKLNIFFFFVIISFNCFSMDLIIEDVEDFIDLTPDEEARSLKSELDDENFEYLNNLYLKKDRTIIPRDANRDIFKSDTYDDYGKEFFYVYIKKNNVIFDFKSKKPYYISRNITALATRDKSKTYELILLDKDKKPKFLISVNNVENLEHETDLSPTPKKYETYKPKIKRNSSDKFPGFSTQFECIA